jgi:hypothetical protein
MPMSVVATSQSLPHDNTVAASIAAIPREVHWLAELIIAKPAQATPATAAASTHERAPSPWYSDPAASRGM